MHNLCHGRSFVLLGYYKDVFHTVSMDIRIRSIHNGGILSSGGAYSIQLHGHVRMDLLYGGWSERTQNRWDSVTSLITIAYLVLLLYGGIDSLIYAISYGERSYSIWRPYMWPIKLIMSLGIFLMLLQLISQFFKDVASARGEKLS